MKDQLKSYIDLLFAGAPNAEDMKQEIMQNTLDRYDDLVAQGKSPEAAYRLAISGIGDINEILGGEAPADPTYGTASTDPRSEAEKINGEKKLMRAIAVALYICCIVPVIIIQNEVGICLMFVMIAAATALIIIAGKNRPEPRETPKEETLSPRQELRRSVKSIIWAIGLAVYFILSFATGAWYITWVIFPLIAAVQGLVIACMDLKEANAYEK